MHSRMSYFLAAPLLSLTTLSESYMGYLQCLYVLFHPLLYPPDPLLSDIYSTRVSLSHPITPNIIAF